LVQHFSRAHLQQGPCLALEVLAGAFAYSLILWQFHRKRVQAFYFVIRNARRGGGENEWLNQIS
jgi:hypothetical protein